MFCHHQLYANRGAYSCFCTCHSCFSSFHRKRSWMRRLAGKPSWGTKLSKAGREAQDDVLPHQPNLSPAVTALENTCMCCCLLWQSCQLLLPAVIREQHIGKCSGTAWSLMEASKEEGGNRGKAIMFVQEFWSLMQRKGYCRNRQEPRSCQSSAVGSALTPALLKTLRKGEM